MNIVLLGSLLAVAAWLLFGPSTASGYRNTRPVGEPARTEVGAGDVQDVGLLLELLGACLDAGSSITGALETVAEVAAPERRTAMRQLVAGLRIGASWQHSWAAVSHPGPLLPIYRALSFAALTGAPAAAILYADARQLRAQEQRAAEKRAAALGVRLVVPLGLCSLPAFICLGVVPVVLALLP